MSYYDRMRLSPVVGERNVQERERRFGPVVRRNLASSLVRQLSEAIRSGALKPGDRLPTEQEMTAQFGVSRTVVREAVAALTAEGLVIKRHGVGVFVETNVQNRPFRIDPDGLGQLQEVLKVMELRMSVEVEAAGLAAERRGKNELRRLADALRAIEADIRAGDLAVHSDFAFHVAVAEASGNHYFSRFLEFLGHFIIPRQTVSRLHGGVDIEYLNRVQAEHRRIYEEITAGDSTGARKAMRTHLVNSRTRYSKLAQDLTIRQKEPAKTH
jgi:GntR family transcriptional repressor for pyruvate dehydrogenase complex